jgi:hypothetical protein
MQAVVVVRVIQTQAAQVVQAVVAMALQAVQAALEPQILVVAVVVLAPRHLAETVVLEL